MVFFDGPNQVISYFDPLGGVCTALKELLVTATSESESEWTFEWNLGVNARGQALQTDGFQCGVWALMARILPPLSFDKHSHTL